MLATITYLVVTRRAQEVQVLVSVLNNIVVAYMGMACIGMG